jgi:hypothetical protein
LGMRIRGGALTRLLGLGRCIGLRRLDANFVARCIALNATSLVCGIVGNIFLLCNFTRVVRYIIALPMSIFLWLVSTAIVRIPACPSRRRTLTLLAPSSSA